METLTFPLHPVRQITGQYVAVMIGGGGGRVQVETVLTVLDVQEPTLL